MIPLNPWEHQNAVKNLYAKCVGPVCAQHGITRMELDILLFLANNPCFDTATDIVEIRYLSKSQVSASIKAMEQRGYVSREYAGGNHKTAHLKICSPAEEIIQDGRAAQERFLQIILTGFSEEDVAAIKQFNNRIMQNIDIYLREGS